MPEGNFPTAAVIGTGMMGPGITVILGLGGVEATILSRTGEGAEKGLAKAHSLLGVLKENELAESERAGPMANGSCLKSDLARRRIRGAVG